LTKIDFAKFNQVLFKECKISGIHFNKLNPLFLTMEFEKCAIKHCDFSDIKLNKTKFTSSILEGCDFISTELKGANFRKVKFEDVVFDNCNLTEANFLGAEGFRINPTNNKIFKAKFNRDNLLGLVYDFGIITE